MFSFRVLFGCFTSLSCTLLIVSGGTVSLCSDGDRDLVEDCCDGPLGNFVEDSSIDVNYIVFQQNRDQPITWGLDAHVTWNRSVGNDTSSFSYAVNIAFSVSPQRAMGEFSPGEGNCGQFDHIHQNYPPESCLLPDYETWTIVNETSVTIRNLTFGYQYRFQIRVFERGLASAFATCLSNELFFTPDCYLSTNDEEFCRTYVTPAVSSSPVNLTVTSGTVQETSNGELEWNITIEWKAPLSVNGMITFYRITVVSGGSYIVHMNVEDSLPPDHLFQHNFMVIRTGDVFEIEVTPLTVLPFKPSSLAASGHPSRIRVNPDDLLEEEIHLTDAVDTTVFKATAATKTGGTTATKTDGSTMRGTGRPGDVLNGFLLWIILGGSFLALVIILAVIVAAIRLDRCFRSKPIEPPVESFYPFREKYFINEVNEKQNLVEDVFKDREIFDYSHIEEGEVLGNGAFGIVKKGRALLPGATTWTDVAIKVPKTGLGSSSDGILDDFKNEIRLMIELGKHNNIISVLGCCTVCEPYYLITEYMPYGDLLHFLQKCYDEKNALMDPIYKLDVLNQLQIARQIAEGMNYVSNTRFFHGDLAARNILVGENLSVKITDFGLTDDLYQSGYTRFGNKKRPLKWYSPESIENKYCTLKTDIWSFGVVLWEIFTFGRQTPYHGMSINEVVHRLVKTDYRLPQPPKCPNMIYVVMLACWELNPAKRPPFAELLDTLNFIINKFGDHTNYVFTEDENSTGNFPAKLRHKSSLLSIISSQSESIYASGASESGYASTISSFDDSSTSADVSSGSDLSSLRSFVTDSDFVVTGEDAVAKMEPILEELDDA